MNPATTLGEVKIANANDPAGPKEKKLIIPYSSGETDFLTYNEVKESIANIEQTNATAQDQIDWRNMKKALYLSVIEQCNEELGITDE